MTLEQKINMLIQLADQKEMARQGITNDDLKELEQDLNYLVKEKEILIADNNELHERIKLNVKEHYKDFMSDYDTMLEEYHQLWKTHEELLEKIRNIVN